MHRIFRSVLAVPLVGKLIGANVIIVASAIFAQTVALRDGSGAELATVIIALAAASVANLFLVRLALRPIEELNDLAGRVSEGLFDARAKSSPLADDDLTRLGETVNGLLDSLATERRRIQDLGAQVVRAQDAERANVSRELHDSIAQTLAAVRLQLSAAGREDDAEDMRSRVTAANGMISAVMEDIVNVSYSLHSRVSEDLGLEAALGTLARQVGRRSGLDVRVVVAPSIPSMSASVSSTLFRVAVEALRDIEMHSGANSATVDVLDRGGSVRIEVAAEGSGFEPAPGAIILRPVLAAIRDRVLLAGGRMKIDSAPNGGICVSAELQTLRAAI
ncbi:MAG: histidine kinase [Gemmatimonadales bacterium]